MAQKHVIVSYQNLSEDVIDALNFKYPDGFENHVIKVDKGNNNYFYAVTVDYKDTSYLVKVDVSIDSNLDEFENEVDEVEDIDVSDEENNELLTNFEDEPSSEDEDFMD